MKNKILFIVLCFAGITASMDAFSWGQKGHDVTCAVAQRHLTKKAQKQISYLLDGKSIVYWANWMDNASHQREYSYTEWADQIDVTDRAAAAAIASGTPDDWAAETFGITRKIYDATPVGSDLSYDYVGEWAPVAEQQLLRGGLRLAALLNSIFK